MTAKLKNQNIKLAIDFQYNGSKRKVRKEKKKHIGQKSSFTDVLVVAPMELPQHKQTFYINLYETKILEGTVPAAHHLLLRDEAGVGWYYIC